MYYLTRLTAVLFVVLLTNVALAQRGEGRPDRARVGQDRQGRGERRGQPGMNRDRDRDRDRLGPLMKVLDVDKNGELSAAEIENAAEALKQLDKDGDGTLSRQELRPARGEGERGGPEGGRGPGGGNMVDRIMSNDANGDGKVAKDEMPERMQRMLERIDTNGDEAIDQAEAEAFAEQMTQRRGNRGERPKDAEGNRRRGRDREQP